MAGIATRLVHEASPPDALTGAIDPPIYATSTFRQEKLDDHQQWTYARTGNPTRAILEQAIARLEGGVGAFAFASGMAAIDNALHILSHGDHVIAAEETYGGTRRILDHAYRRLGIRVTYMASRDPSEWEAEITSKTRLLLLETPSNPLLRIAELPRFAKLARAHRVLLGVDNTLATPYLQRPLELGADFVIHSATKYLGGHGDLLAGILVARKRALADRFAFLQNAVGAVCGPWDAWLLLRGLKTLHLRMEAAGRNATDLATFLEAHPRVARVWFPGLPSHPDFELARRQMRGPGGLMSFECKGPHWRRALRSHGSITLAESLGSVETLICHPWTMTHASIPAARRHQLGISRRLIRVSVGVEDVDDLRRDFRRLLQ